LDNTTRVAAIWLHSSGKFLRFLDVLVPVDTGFISEYVLVPVDTGFISEYILVHVDTGFIAELQKIELDKCIGGFEIVRNSIFTCFPKSVV